MKNRTIVALVLAAFGGSIAYSQQIGTPITTDGRPVKLFIGQPLKDAKAALEARRLEYGENGFAIAVDDPDQANLNVGIDPNHTRLCLFYSTSQARVTGLSMVFFPSRRSPRINHSWISATEIALHEDGSYSVRFAPPLTEAELKRLERDRTRDTP